MRNLLPQVPCHVQPASMIGFRMLVLLHLALLCILRSLTAMCSVCQSVSLPLTPLHTDLPSPSRTRVDLCIHTQSSLPACLPACHPLSVSRVRIRRIPSQTGKQTKELREQEATDSMHMRGKKIWYLPLTSPTGLVGERRRTAAIGSYSPSLATGGRCRSCSVRASPVLRRCRCHRRTFSKLLAQKLQKL